MTDFVPPLEDIFHIVNLVRHGGVMRVRLVSELNPEEVVELAPLDILEDTPPTDNPPEAIPVAFGAITGDAPFVAIVRDQSTGLFSSRTWDWGDGSDPEVETADEGLVLAIGGSRSHEYEEAGVYTFILSLEGPGGADEATLEFTATTPP